MRIPAVLLLMTASLTACHSVSGSRIQTSTPAATQARPARPDQTPVLASNTVVKKDVAFGADRKLQALDVYSPKDAKDAPVVIFIHGGGWTRSDKHELSAKPRWLNQNNIVLVSTNYRLSPAVQHPEHVNDIAAAVKWTVDNIAKHGGSPKKIFLMGHSAGSHLAALAAVHPKALAAHDLTPANIAGVISLDGSAFDIPDRIEKGTPNLADNCRRAFGTSLENQRDGSPLHHVRANLPPFLLVYVKDEGLNRAQSTTFANALQKSGNKAAVIKSTAADHFSLDHELGTPTDPASRAILDFIHSHSR
jgi:acetyl esterase/lipase